MLIHTGEKRLQRNIGPHICIIIYDSSVRKNCVFYKRGTF